MRTVEVTCNTEWTLMCVQGQYVAAFMQPLSIECDHIGTRTMQLAMRNTCAPLKLLTHSRPMWDHGEVELE